MAKYEANLKGDLKSIVAEVENRVKNSLSASCEENSSYRIGDTRVVIRAYERYSFMGGNRVSLTVVFAERENAIRVTAISTGGSQAMLFKVNTYGEESFLNTIVDVLEKYK